MLSRYAESEFERRMICADKGVTAWLMVWPVRMFVDSIQQGVAQKLLRLAVFCRILLPEFNSVMGGMWQLCNQ